MKAFLLRWVIFGAASLSLLAQPVITQPLTNQVLAAGATLTLRVTASDPLAACQWFKDGRRLLGATNNILTVENSAMADSGAYYVVVTNAEGMAICPPALVMVGDPCLLAWGNNNSAQLGNGRWDEAQTTPILVASNVVAAAAGAEHSLFVTGDGTLWATGGNTVGELGNGILFGGFQNAPTPIPVASNVVTVAAGSGHSLFVKADGTLWAMGENTYGELGLPLGKDAVKHIAAPVLVTSNVVAVAAGSGHSLFVKTDGTLWAMGLNSLGQLGNDLHYDSGIPNPTPALVASNVVSVAAGGGHSLFVTADGTLWVMGYYGHSRASRDLKTEAADGATPGVIALVTGSSGVADHDTETATHRPVSVANDVVAVAAGAGHSLFVKTDGTLWTMGLNHRGQLGDGTISGHTIYHSTPVGVASNVLAVAAGADYSLFVKTDGTLWAMGGNQFGQLGNGSTVNTKWPIQVSDQPVANLFPAECAQHALALGNRPPPPPTITVIAGPTNQMLAAGGTLALAVTAGGNAPLAYQWFKDGRRLLSATNRLLTVTNASLTDSGAYSVVVANASRMVISRPALVAVAKPSLLVWGANGSGQLGNGTIITALGPTKLAWNIVTGAAGPDDSVFVAADGTLWGMGNGANGQLGTYKETIRPVRIGSNVVAVAAGADYSLFVKSDGTLWGLGVDYFGELGSATRRKDNATQVCVASNVAAVAAGARHSLFVNTDGTLLATGDNSFGQLGCRLMGLIHRPIWVANQVVAVTAGAEHSLFVKLDGTLWAMGRNNCGQLGNGTVINTNQPIEVASNVVALAAGARHSLFVTTDGTLWAMGDNSFGQLGNGTAVNATWPISVASNVVAVAAGADYSLFAQTDGTLWAMGANNWGQLGNGTVINTNRPGKVPQILVANLFPAALASHCLVLGSFSLPAPVSRAQAVNDSVSR